MSIAEAASETSLDLLDLLPAIAQLSEARAQARAAAAEGLSGEEAVAAADAAEEELVLSRLAQVDEWFDSAQQVPALALLRRWAVEDRDPALLESQAARQVESENWTPGDINAAMRKRFVSKTDNSKYFNFDFNSLPEFEPLELTLRLLRRDPGDPSALRKICEMDHSELSEHPQWEELLALLSRALAAENPHGDEGALEALRVMSKLLLVFSGHQYLQTCLAILGHMVRVWCSQLTFGRGHGPDPIVARRLLCSCPLLRQLVSTLVLLVETLPRNLASAPEKLADATISQMFLVLAHGSIAVESEGDELEIQFSILDLILPSLVGSGAFEKLLISWPLVPAVSHIIHSGFAHVLFSKLTLSLDINYGDNSSDTLDEDDKVWRWSYYLSAIRQFSAIIEAASHCPRLMSMYFIEVGDLMKPIDRTVPNAEQLLCFHPFDMYWDGKLEPSVAVTGTGAGARGSSATAAGTALYSASGPTVLLEHLAETNKRHWQLSGTQLSLIDLLDESKELDDSTFTGAIFRRFCTQIEGSHNCQVFIDNHLEIIAASIMAQISFIPNIHLTSLLSTLNSFLLVLRRASPALHCQLLARIWPALWGLLSSRPDLPALLIIDFILNQIKVLDFNPSLPVTAETESAPEVYISILLDISDVIFSNSRFLVPFYGSEDLNESFDSPIEPQIIQTLILYLSCWEPLLSTKCPTDNEISDKNLRLYYCLWIKFSQQSGTNNFGDMSENLMQEINVRCSVLREVIKLSTAILGSSETRLAIGLESCGERNVTGKLSGDEDNADNLSTLIDIRHTILIKRLAGQALELLCLFCQEVPNCEHILTQNCDSFLETLRLLTRISSIRVTTMNSSDLHQLFSLYFESLDINILQKAYLGLVWSFSLHVEDIPEDLSSFIIEDFGIVVNFLESCADLSLSYVYDVSGDIHGDSIVCFANISRALVQHGFRATMEKTWMEHWSACNGQIAFESLDESCSLSTDSLFPLLKYIFC